MAIAGHKIWNCVAIDMNTTTWYEEADRPFRVNAASIQGFCDDDVEVALFVTGGVSKYYFLQIARLSAKHPQVDLDIAFNAGDTYRFFRQCKGFGNAKVQLMGYYLDDCEACTRKNLKKWDDGEIDKIKTGVEELLKGKNVGVEGLYNQVRELRVKMQEIETLLKPDEDKNPL